MQIKTSCNKFKIFCKIVVLNFVLRNIHYYLVDIQRGIKIEKKEEGGGISHLHAQYRKSQEK